MMTHNWRTGIIFFCLFKYEPDDICLGVASTGVNNENYKTNYNYKLDILFQWQKLENSSCGRVEQALFAIEFVHVHRIWIRFRIRFIKGKMKWDSKRMVTSHRLFGTSEHLKHETSDDRTSGIFPFFIPNPTIQPRNGIGKTSPIRKIIYYRLFENDSFC